MAYLRWGNDSEWYVFWQNSPAIAKADERVAIWNADVGDQEFSATYDEVRAMLASDDFTRVPGYTTRSHEVIAMALASFVEDVDLDYTRNPGS